MATQLHRAEAILSYIGPDPASVRHFGAEEAFKDLKLSKRAVTGLVRAGVLTPGALIKAAWTDEEARAKLSSLRWRLSVDPEVGSKAVAEIERARARLL
jgi:hypothetical protein